MRDDRLLIPDQTCWRAEHADQLACIIDADEYFRRVKAAMLRAKHRIMLVGWDFDTRTAFERGGKKLAGPNQLGAFLYWLLWRRSTLEIYVLKSNLRLLPAFDGIWYGITPVSVVNRLSSRRLHFAIDGARPTGAVHHQKIVIIDDVLAFCGGIDLTLDRWDTPEHKHNNRFRRALGRRYGPRHEVAAAGMDVWVTGRTAARIEAVASEIGGQALVGDVSQEDDVARWFEQMGPVDLLVNNAGVQGPTVTFDQEEPAGPEELGTVKFFAAAKGFGFITRDSGGKDAFVHVTALNRAGVPDLAEGQRVSMTVRQGKKGPEVVGLRLV